MSNQHWLKLLILCVVLMGCSVTPEQVKDYPLTFRPTGWHKTSVGFPIAIKVEWCEGTFPVTSEHSRSLTRTVIVRFRQEFEIESQVGIEALGELKARIALHHERELGEEITESSSIQTSTAQGTRQFYDLQPEDMWESGVVSADIPGIGRVAQEYAIRVGITYSVRNSRVENCDGTPHHTTSRLAPTQQSNFTNAEPTSEWYWLVETYPSK